MKYQLLGNLKRNRTKKRIIKNFALLLDSKETNLNVKRDTRKLFEKLMKSSNNKTHELDSLIFIVDLLIMVDYVDKIYEIKKSEREIEEVKNYIIHLFSEIEANPTLKLISLSEVANNRELLDKIIRIHYNNNFITLNKGIKKLNNQKKEIVNYFFINQAIIPFSIYSTMSFLIMSASSQVSSSELASVMAIAGIYISIPAWLKLWRYNHKLKELLQRISIVDKLVKDIYLNKLE